MTDKLRDAAQQALDVLEQLQGGCTDSDDGTVEAITVWCPEVVEALRAALAEQTAQSPTPDWISYNKHSDVLTIHGRRYDAALFDERGFGSPPGTLLRIVDGPADVVTLERVAEQQDAQKKHKPLFAEMIAQHPGLAEELAQQDAQAVPVVWMGKMDFETLKSRGRVTATLYGEPVGNKTNEVGLCLATPTPPTQRVMLTDDEIDVLWAKQQAKPFKTHGEDRMAFARAVIEAYERKNGAETTPPAQLPEARQWTGLTDIGVYFAITAAGKPPNPMSEEFFAWCEKFADAIEANLKERNA